MPLYSLGELRPQTAGPGTYWIAPGAHVIGDVVLGEDVGIWFGAVLRGDKETLTIGHRTNIQDHSMVHADPGFPLTIGSDVTIGHRATVHGCTIGDGSLIGMGATILNGAIIGRECLIGAGALVTEGKEVPDGSLVIGAPAKIARELDETTRKSLRRPTDNYVLNWKRFSSELAVIEE